MPWKSIRQRAVFRLIEQQENKDKGTAIIWATEE